MIKVVDIIIRLLGDLIKPNKDTRNIVFLGCKESGKTTMWRFLKDELKDQGYSATTTLECVSAFDLSVGNKTVTITDSFDGSGDNEQTSLFYYAVLSNFCKQKDAKKGNNIFIYYLINQRDVQKLERDIKAQLRKIDEVSKRVKSEHPGLNIGLAMVLTNFQKGKKINIHSIDNIVKMPFKYVAYKHIHTFDINHKKADIEKLKNDIIEGYE